MKKIIILFSIVFLLSLQLALAKTSKRHPSQDLESDYVEEALRTPHNCRVVIHYVYFSGTEKVEILPFKVKSESECRATAKLFRPITDKRIKAKNVNHVWINVELP